ncbi:MAG TPA: DUF1573 domain-containing protein [Candidatus Hydrogenedentes bacterium]|nr:DUF1573 domain-containing protein [Candidatus Hydrogenedentota bacterium]
MVQARRTLCVPLGRWAAVAAVVLATGLSSCTQRNGAATPLAQVSAAPAPTAEKPEPIARRGTEESLDPGMAAKPDAPRIEVSTLELDLGTVPNNKLTKAEVTVRNVGKSSLKLQEPRSGCGCTKVSLDQTELAAGAETTLRITLDPFRLSGAFETKKEVTLRSNDPFLPIAKITVSAKIDPEFSIEPAAFDFGEVRRGTTVEKTAVLRQLGEEPIDIVAIEASPRNDAINFSYAIRPEEEWATPDRPEYVITAAVAEDAAPGSLKANCFLRLGCARIKNYRIPATATLKTFYELSSRRPFFRGMEAGQRAESILKITAEKPFELSELAITDDELHVASRIQDGGKTAVFDLEVSPTTKEGVKRAIVTFLISSEDERYRERIPLQGIIKPKPPGGPESQDAARAQSAPGQQGPEETVQ